MADRGTQTADMAGITAQHALNEVLGVAGLMALAAEMRRTAESGEVGEVLLGAVLEILNALDMVKASAVLHQTLEENVRVVHKRVLLGGSSTTRCGGPMTAIGFVVIIIRSTTWFTTFQFDLLFTLAFFFLNEALIDHGLVEIGIVSLLVADPAGIAVILTFRALPSLPLFTHGWI